MAETNRISIAAGLLLSWLPPVSAAEPPAIAPGQVLWRGCPAGIDLGPGDRALELAPDGRSFLYLQGAPWPRLMLQPLEPAGAEPLMLGTSIPFGNRPPRFDLEGKWVFFTADLDWRPPRPLPPGQPPADVPVRTAAVQVSVDGGVQKTVAPGPGAALGSFAVFLDLHPDGRTVLAGIGTGLRRADVPAGEYSIELREIQSESGLEKPLGIRVPGGAAARYSWDGRSIYYTLSNSIDSSAPIHRYDRAGGLHQPAGRDAIEIGWLAGDVAAGRALLPHPGSFGRDAFPACFLARALDDPPVILRLEAGFPGASDGALVPRTVRGRRILLGGGLEDRPLVLVAEWDAEAFLARLSAARAQPASVLAPWIPEARARLAEDLGRSALRAAMEPGAVDLIRGMSRSLVLLPGAPLRQARARWRRESGEGRGGPARTTVVASESASGLFRAERIFQPADTEGTPRREVRIFDGRRGWLAGDGGESASLSLAAIEIERGFSSPYRLLIDPAGLSDPALSFRRLDDGGGGGTALAFRHLDGFHGVLRLQVEGDRVLPARIETPLLFPSLRARRGMGEVPEIRSIAFEDYRPVSGRMVPHRLRFDDGLDPFTLVLEEISFNPELTDPPFGN